MGVGFNTERHTISYMPLAKEQVQFSGMAYNLDWEFFAMLAASPFGWQGLPAT